MRSNAIDSIQSAIADTALVDQRARVPSRRLTGRMRFAFALTGSRVFSGNGRVIVFGITAGVFLLLFAGFLFDRHQRSHGGQPLSFTKFIRARTHTISASPRELVPPAPVVVQIDEKLLHVSGIALGHPRLAVINGQSVTEGDSVKVSSANPTVTLLLRVLKIGDGRIDLTDGTQVITTRLFIPKLDRNKAN